jgi:hypothetical protein
VPALQAKRDAGFGQKNPASGGMKPAIACVAALARCLASRGAPRLLDGRFDAMKWVPITAGWYDTKYLQNLQKRNRRQPAAMIGGRVGPVILFWIP